jgi:hypothetical protein
MNNKLVIVLALVAGLVGGLLSRYAAPPSAFAQNQAAVTKEIRAESFTLVDSMNRPVGTFVSAPAGPLPPPPPPGAAPLPESRAARTRVVLKDSSGQEIWSAPANTRMVPLSQIQR